MTTVAATVAAPVRVRTKTPFYVGLTFFMVAIVLFGFWPSDSLRP
jgi:hypothetical protein